MPSHNSHIILVSGVLLLRELVLASPTTSPFRSNTDCPKSLALSAAEASLHDSRSVWNIIWSCVTTIISCCWIAVHPNMLEADATVWRSTTHRLSHMVWMIIAPELMICFAMRQWVGARTLMKKSPYNKKGHEWTMTHGFFLQMGGFMLDTPEPDILSAERIERVNDRQAAFPKITAREINDRSKRDGLSKTIAIGQTTWFLAQCLTRRAQGLVTTELELVTIAFAALNVFVYFFWWDKPMDVQTTVTVSESRVVGETEGIVNGFELKPSVSHPLRPTSSRNVPRTQATLPTTYDRIKASVRLITMSHAPFMFVFQTVLREVFARIGNMLLESPPINPGMKRVFTFYALDTTKTEKFIVLACAGLIGVLFGGIHCVGWEYFFPSHAELLIWRACSIAITAVPALVAFGAFAFYAEEKFKDGGVLEKTFGILGGISLSLGAFGLIPYIVARVLLLVEAFISLRDLPPDALLAVRWTGFLPHL